MCRSVSAAGVGVRASIRQEVQPNPKWRHSLEAATMLASAKVFWTATTAARRATRDLQSVWELCGCSCGGGGGKVLLAATASVCGGGDDFAKCSVRGGPVLALTQLRALSLSLALSARAAHTRLCRQ